MCAKKKHTKLPGLQWHRCCLVGLGRLVHPDSLACCIERHCCDLRCPSYTHDSDSSPNRSNHWRLVCRSRLRRQLGPREGDQMCVSARKPVRLVGLCCPAGLGCLGRPDNPVDHTRCHCFGPRSSDRRHDSDSSPNKSNHSRRQHQWPPCFQLVPMWGVRAIKCVRAKYLCASGARDTLRALDALFALTVLGVALRVAILVLGAKITRMVLIQIPTRVSI